MTRNPILFSFTAIILLLGLVRPAFSSESYVAAGEVVDGYLERGDDQLEDECYFDTYLYDGSIGDLLTVSQTSAEIDCYLIVVGPDGTQWENDDFGGTFDSQVSVLIREQGAYEIWATSYSPSEGPYLLSVEVQKRPRYFGVFVGIEDYGDIIGEAPLCDDDAENLYEAFVDTGLMESANGIVLLNREATVREVTGAVEELAGRMTQDDVFVFFFSGHGTQLEEQSDEREPEPDGLDEAISLRDADMVDDELAEMMGSIDARLKLVVLDSCNSGGMAEDVVAAENTVFYGSSEEDVLSGFAPELDAGGYLSAFIREAIDGDADLDGDGVILIGELTHYLLRRYYELVPDPDSPSLGYQELAHDRGTVSQDAILCWWIDEGATAGPEK